jgi:hypothetical protein
MLEPTPNASYEVKVRYLRRLYRQHKPSSRWTATDKLIIDQAKQAEQWRVVKAEYERLFTEAEVPLAYILVNVWTEARELAGWDYDCTAQCWRRADRSPVVEDDGSEWAHL